MWTIEKHTKENAGYFRILRNGKRVADAFPFADTQQESDRVIDDLHWLLDAANETELRHTAAPSESFATPAKD